MKIETEYNNKVLFKRRLEGNKMKRLSLFVLAAILGQLQRE